MIAWGLYILWRIGRGQASIEAEQAAIPLSGAGRARLRIHHAAGRLEVTGGAGPGNLVEGTFRGGLDYHANERGDLLEVEMRVPRRSSPFLSGPWHWGPGSTLDWSFALSDRVPLALELETGANDAHLDLTELRVTDLRLKTGASSTQVRLSAQAGHTRVSVESGAASLRLEVPGGVAARIRTTGALSSTDIDTTRFPRSAGGYESPDYAVAENKVDIDVEAAVGSVDIS